MYHVQKLCRAALWLKDGRVERYGAAAEVCQAYLAYHEEKSARREAARLPAPGAAPQAFMRCSALDARSACKAALRSGATDDRAGKRSRRTVARPSCSIGMVRADGTPVYGVGTDMDGVRRAGSRRTGSPLR